MTMKHNAIPGADDIAREVLPNGIVVLARENFSNQSVVITGTLEVGSVFEGRDKAGLAGFVGSALMRGTKSRDFDMLHETLESLGASLSIGGNTHTTGFGGKALAEDLPTLLALLSDALRNPAFPPDQIERLRGEFLTSLKIRQQNTRAVAGDTFRRLAYPSEHPYSVSSADELKALPAISLDEMAEFHSRYFGPRGMILVVVGAVKAQDAIRQVGDIFGDWQNPDQPPPPSLPDAPPPPDVLQEFKVLPGKSQADVIIGWPGPSRYAPDFQAANLANSILGEFGMMGRLGQNVREKQGLAYTASSRLRGGRGQGAWTASAGVNPQHVRRAVASMLDEIKRMTSELVSEEELADNKANFTGRLPLSLESNEGVAGSILNMETYQLGLDYLRNYADMINAITREDILQAAQHYMSPAAYALAVAGPEIKDE